jgi:DNA (cytosine-5)-methyltransferase 1
MRTVAFCEIEPFGRAVLAKHWPNVPCYDDVRSQRNSTCCRWNLRRCHLRRLPVPGHLARGPRRGLAANDQDCGANTPVLWASYDRRYAIVENVAALNIRGLLDVLGDIAEIGFDAEWHCIPASYVGAWHRRDRTWILAYPVGQLEERGCEAPILRQRHLSLELSRGFAEWRGRSNLPASRFHRGSDGPASWMDRIAACGNAVVPQMNPGSHRAGRS